MTNTASTNQDVTIREVAERYVADLSPTTDCAFNVAKKGQHRFCSRMGRRYIGGRCFCLRHADVIAKAVFESVKERLPSMEQKGVMIVAVVATG